MSPKVASLNLKNCSATAMTKIYKKRVYERKWELSCNLQSNALNNLEAYKNGF